MGSPLLCARGLAVGHRQPVLSGIELSLCAGEWWFLLGRSGSGKTTLLHTLAQLLPALRGSVTWEGDGERRTALGFVPQEPPAAPSLPMQLSEFVALGTAGMSLAAREVAQRTSAALVQLGLGERGGQQFAELSLGQRRRALVARALVRKPRLMLLDEPTASLDPGTAQQLAADLDALRTQHGLCLVLGCHDLELARKFATHVALVDGGGVANGAAAALFGSGRIERALGLEARS